MNLTLRTIKGKPLTWQELDDNFIYLDQKSSSSVASGITYDNSVSGLISDNVQDAIDEVITLIGDNVYTNSEPSVLEVGGIPVGTTFNNTTFSQFMDMLLYPELFGDLTSPSSTFVSSVTGFREIGETISSINFTSTLNRGSINPQYMSDSPYRSGLPNQHVLTGTGLSNVITTDLSIVSTINNYTVLIGNQNWTGRIAYDVGVQPKGSKGTNYNSPLTAGQTSIITRTITGVYPVFATTFDITTMTKQTLVAMNSTYFQVNLVAETGGNKQTIDIPLLWSTITGIQFYNTVSSTWEWIGGSKLNSLLTFTITDTTNNIQGSVIDYKKWTHNGDTIGARQLRFYTN